VRRALVLVVAAACGPTDDLVAVPDGAEDRVDAGDDDDDATHCAVLPVIVRDFQASHPDFEDFSSDAVTLGLVESTIGPDRTPIYAHPGGTVCTSGPAAFADWYHDVPGTNLTIETSIELLETAPGVHVFDSSSFFPIDGQGFGDEGQPHNYWFTTEIHTSFVYRGGEVFTFRGDDDVWLFINDRLAIDLGGLHQPAGATVDLDARAGELGLVVGERYPMEIFQAERHTTQSNFRIETTIECFDVPD
jgi:fibro-slime domain-containing protein